MVERRPSKPYSKFVLCRRANKFVTGFPFIKLSIMEKPPSGPLYSVFVQYVRASIQRPGGNFGRDRAMCSCKHDLGSQYFVLPAGFETR